MPDLDGRKAISIACGTNHSAILLEDGTPLFFGNKMFGKLYIPDLDGHKATAVACCADFSIVVADDKVFLFGDIDEVQFEDVNPIPE